MVFVFSSSIEAVGYDLDAQTLDIKFRDFGTYRYSGVPRAVFDRLLASTSKGGFVNKEIRDKFPFERL